MRRTVTLLREQRCWWWAGSVACSFALRGPVAARITTLWTMIPRSSCRNRLLPPQRRAEMPTVTTVRCVWWRIVNCSGCSTLNDRTTSDTPRFKILSQRLAGVTEENNLRLSGDRYPDEDMNPMSIFAPLFLNFFLFFHSYFFPLFLFFSPLCFLFLHFLFSLYLPNFSFLRHLLISFIYFLLSYLTLLFSLLYTLFLAYFVRFFVSVLHP